MIKRVYRDSVYAQSVRQIFELSPTSGDVGIEIEVEGNKFPKTKAELSSKVWSFHEDHSLRGEDNAEYVLTKPRNFSDVKKDVNAIFDCLTKFGSVLDDSNRTSVHVHLNCQSFYANRIAAFSALYFSLEELLSEWCGEHRVGNLFCLRAKDATGIIKTIRNLIKTDFQTAIPDGMHYSAFNVQALGKFGSIEIRTLRGATDPDLIVKWVAILQRIYEYSAEFKDPREVINLFSYGGPDNYLQTVLGEHTSVLLEGIDWHHERVRDSLYEGIRLAQDICYCRDWDLFVAIPNPDPFNRTKKSPCAEQVLTASSLMQDYLSAHPPLPSTAVGQSEWFVQSLTSLSSNPPSLSPTFEEPEEDDDYEPEPEYDEDEDHEEEE